MTFEVTTQLWLTIIFQTYTYSSQCNIFYDSMKGKSNRMAGEFLIKLRIYEKLFQNLRGINPAWQRELTYTTNQYSKTKNEREKEKIRGSLSLMPGSECSLG